MNFSGFPPPQGLYHPSFEKDACGVGLVAHVKGLASHQNITDSLLILKNLAHRGAAGSDSQTGDGAGILTQIPHELFNLGRAPGSYAVGMAFFPVEETQFQNFKALIEKAVLAFRCKLISWRNPPLDDSTIGDKAKATQPRICQFFVEPPAQLGEGVRFEQILYRIKAQIEAQARSGKLAGIERFHVVSLSPTSIVYKGLLLPEQLSQFYVDLSNPQFKTAIAMVHSRFSTNTFPSWPLAHPYRYLCHNGEINTLKGNLNWMRARQGKSKSDDFPIIQADQSDSACLDNALEYLVMSGRSLPHALSMLIPEPWMSNASMDLDRRAYYEYHAAILEPWDGPAAVICTDGKVVAATLDRNGLRPCRYQITKDDRVILSSEAGVLPIDPAEVLERGRLQPGKMLLVDTEAGRIISDDELKANLAKRKPYRAWVSSHRLSLSDLPEPDNIFKPKLETLRDTQRVFGYTDEELRMILTPMAVHGEEALSSMGSDIPLAVLSPRPRLLFDYFKQLFAQVTNPPIDPIREHLVMSLATFIGPKAVLSSEEPEACKRIKIQQPILTNSELQKIREISDPDFQNRTLNMVFNASEGKAGLARALETLSNEAVAAVRAGCKFLILSDRAENAERVPIPSLLAVAAVHERLIVESLRTETGLLLETGDPREVHHFACLIGYGAGAINPYLAFDTLDSLARAGDFPEGIDSATAHSKYIKALSKGLLKVFSKMGISTVQSYCGAQLFEALGLGPRLMNSYFARTPSRIGGIELEQIAEDCLIRHREGYESGHHDPLKAKALDPGGQIHYRLHGEHHMWNPESITQLQQATRTGNAETFKLFSEAANETTTSPSTLRALMDFHFSDHPLSIGEVESAAEIVKRFTTGAMSLGAISEESHQGLAIAMNRIGAKSNTGEGGEDPARFVKRADGDSTNSAIKQVASGRFGVTAHYLVNAKEIQIKMAQGAKPGEGGQLPGHKVDKHIAWLRYSTPGVQLISPPPHHDIYSIEDLAQLISDLKNINAEAEISVKLVSEAGVGTVAAGVAKAGADKILISGDSGGTGASPLSSIQHAGTPWELGLAETHQTLALNGLRSRVRIETDGQLRTGRDVAIAALLGAEEFGFATAPLIVQGCIMMRKCHLNTCPVGIATQDPVLRRKFAGKPEHVINYFFFVAEELRQIMARLGYKSIAEMVGHPERLKLRKDLPARAQMLNLSNILKSADGAAPIKKMHQSLSSPSPAVDELAREIARECAPAIENKSPTKLNYPIRNVNRSVGAYVSGLITRKHGRTGLAEDTIEIQFTGSAGQSFGAFACRGLTLRLEGETNDYIGKGLSGGKLIVYPPKSASFSPNSIVVGNTALYGAVAGEAYISGTAGERFAVRNSGAIVVVEGVGDHGCEYMTGGRVVILGKTGRNFAAGMSGGIAYLLDEDNQTRMRCNLGMVEFEPLFDPTKEGDSAESLQVLADIHNHFRHTQSLKAWQILSEWSLYRTRFIKIIPTEFKKALESQNTPLGGSISG